MATTPSYDYIVVGAGTSGCVVASRLSWRGSVLLLERGPSDYAHYGIIARPENVLSAIMHEPISPRYISEPQPALNGRVMPMIRGVVRGGCSSVNGMIYVRGNRRDFDRWAQMGNEGWSYDDVLPYFRRSENFLGGASWYHGAGGPLDVRPLARPSTAALAFIDAAGRLGFSDSSPYWDFNGPRQENAAGLYQTNVTRQGLRASAAFSFLDAAAYQPNLTVKTGVRTSRIRVVQHRAVGVDCLQDGGVQAYAADREVIVSAGTFESPKLLMLSGIGPAAQLQSHSIPVKMDLPGVGENLQDHLQILIYHWAKRFAGEADFTAEAGLFLNTRDGSGAAAPDLQYHVLAGMPGLLKVDPKAEPYFLTCPVVCAAESRGVIRLASGDPTMAPMIQPNYLQRDSDMTVLCHGIGLARDLLHAGELGYLYDASRPSFAFDFSVRHAPKELSLPASPADWPDFVRRSVVTVWHPAGTCKMGRDWLSVVDPQLRVRGVDGLRVADASVMPTIPSGNTNAACYMIGEVCAEAVGG